MVLLKPFCKRFLKHLLSILLLVSTSALNVCAQEFAMKDGTRFFLGLSGAIGTHKMRIGIKAGLQYRYRFLQSNTSLTCYYSWRQLGTGLRTPELQLAQGVTVGWGPTTGYTVVPVQHPLANYTQHYYSAGYAYQWYLDRIGTSQPTGVLGFSAGRFQVMSENDLLGKPAMDRFRTAAIQLRWQVDAQWVAGVNCVLWTGKYGWRKPIDHPSVRAGCYQDTVNGKYTRYSVGWLSAFTGYAAPMGNYVQVDAGVDAERIRNTVQNKFMHDMVFLPRRWHNPNCHIPMVDSTGHPFLWLPNQQVRPTRSVMQLQLNAPLFY